MSHYYKYDDSLEHDVHQLIFKFKDQEIKLYSDNGVFSKERIDYGTRALLNAIEINQEDLKVLDVGCGYGPIGLSLKKVYPTLDITMIDVNTRALELAETSAKENQLDVCIKLSDVYENVLDTYDVILTNPPIRAGKKVVQSILIESFNHLNDGGCIYVVIQKKQGAPSAKKSLEEVYGNCEVVDRDKGYYILRSIKRA